MLDFRIIPVSRVTYQASQITQVIKYPQRAYSQLMSQTTLSLLSPSGKECSVKILTIFIEIDKLNEDLENLASNSIHACVCVGPDACIRLPKSRERATVLRLLHISCEQFWLWYFFTMASSSFGASSRFLTSKNSSCFLEAPNKLRRDVLSLASS